MVRTEEKDRDYAKIAEMAQQSADILKVLDDHLVSNHFVAGDQFTFGDIPLGVLIHKYFVLDIKRPPLPGIEAWYERLKERPAFKEHAMQPFGNSPSEFFALQTKGEQSS
jgi:glutathione S-transferase